MILATAHLPAFAEPISITAPNSESKIAQLVLGAKGKPTQSLPKSCEIEWVGNWVEMCHEESYPGYTDRDWDTYTVCEWEWVEVPQEVCAEDCPSAAPVELQRSPQGATKAARGRYDHNPGDKFGLAPDRTYTVNPERRSRFARLKVGVGWFSKWDRSVNVDNGGHTAHVSRGDGSEWLFRKAPNGAWASVTNSAFTLTEFADDGNDLRWLLRGPGIVESFNVVGGLRHLAAPGESYQLRYAVGSGVLEAVTDFRNRKLHFAYDLAGNVSQVSDPEDGITVFDYVADYLVRATYPNGKSRHFGYTSSGKLIVGPLLGEGQKLPARSDTKIGSALIAKAENCPSPCQPWMNLEISACILEAEGRRQVRDRNCLAAHEARVEQNPTVAGVVWSELLLDICLIDSTYTYLIDTLTCKGKYPQCP